MQKDTPSCCVLSLRKPSKHDHVSYGAAKVDSLERQMKTLVNKLEFRTITDSRRAEISSCERRISNKSSDTFAFGGILVNEEI